VASPETGFGGFVGRYQGTHWRRASRCVEAIVFGLLFISPDALANQSLGSKLQAIAVTAVIVAVVDAWFSRRMGLTINDRGITLHYAYFRRSVPWARIEGFEWRRWRRRQSEWIWISVVGGRSVRIPTIQRSAAGHTSSFLGSVLTSESLRLRRGAEMDAMATLQGAHTAMHQEQEGGRTPTFTAPS
jgi:hypothetical protein